MTLGFGNIFDINKGYTGGSESYDEGYNDGYQVGYHDGIATHVTYIHDQSEASTEWLIPHNLDKYPSVTVVDSADTEVITAVNYLDKNTILVQTNFPFKGRAFLN